MRDRTSIETIRVAVEGLERPTTAEDLRQIIGWSQGHFDETLEDAFRGGIVYNLGSGLLGSAKHLAEKRKQALEHLQDGL